MRIRRARLQDRSILAIEVGILAILLDLVAAMAGLISWSTTAAVASIAYFVAALGAVLLWASWGEREVGA